MKYEKEGYDQADVRGAILKTIEVDDDVYEELGKRAIPFKETTPNVVLRRILSLTQGEKTKSIQNSDKSIDQRIAGYTATETKSIMRESPEKKLGIQMVPRQEHSLAAASIHPAFLTFLFDKYCNVKGNFTTADILPFMEKFRFVTSSRKYHNPWMKEPYKNDNSCKSTIEHFRQCRQFGCWWYQDSKQNCMILECPYHPQTNQDLIQRDRCDLTNGIIWKRNGPKGVFSYSRQYVRVVMERLLGGKPAPSREILRLLYPQATFDQALVERFKRDFHLYGEEISLFSF